MPSGENWLARIDTAGVIQRPLDPPAACARCLRPLEVEKRSFGTCWDCGHEHPRAPLRRVDAVTYGAAGTQPWIFFTTAKYEKTSTEKLKRFVTAIGATLSLKVEEHYTDFVTGDVDYIVIPIPSSSDLIRRCLAAIAEQDWPPLNVQDALTAQERPKQTDLNMRERREAASDKYEASAAVAGKHVLLLDDAYTSGFTAHDAARAVVAAGARSVACVVYARRIHADALAIYRAETGEVNGER